VHPEAEAAGYDKMTTIIEIALTDGRQITGRADFGKGSPANPMSYDEVADKFRECAAFSRWPRSKAEEVVALVRRLEELRDMRELTALLGKEAGGGVKRSTRAVRPRKRAGTVGRGGKAAAKRTPRPGRRRSTR